MNRDNEAWLLQLRGGGAEQQAALSDLRDALVRGLHRALAGHGSADEALIEDAAQDSLVRILDRLGQFAGRSRFLTWATSIAIHTAVSELRRRRWKDVSLDALVADAGLELQADDAAQADTESDKQAIFGKMHEVIRSELTEKQRTALVAELRGMPLAEIAEQLGSSRNAVYKLTFDARQRLKRGLETAGYDAAYFQAAFAE